VARDLDHPWAVAFLPDGRMLVTERPGRMRIIGPDGTRSEPLAGLPKVDARAQGGLLDVALAPSFAEDGTIYFAYSEPRPDGSGTALARARRALAGPPRLHNVEVVWRMTPTLDSVLHFGARIVFA